MAEVVTMAQRCLTALGLALAAASTAYSDDTQSSGGAAAASAGFRSEGLKLALSTNAYPEGPSAAAYSLSLASAPELDRLPTFVADGPEYKLADLNVPVFLADEDGTDIVRRSADPLLSLQLRDPQSITYSLSLTASAADTGLPVDVSVTPRATVERGNFGDSLRRGLEVRLGLDLEPEFRDPGRGSWYMFAGADNQIITYSLADAMRRPSLSGVKLEDKLTVGDVQTGVAMEIFRVQGSFSFLSRETSAEHASERDNYGALTLAVRW
jgi:hypothetical protein